MDSSAEPKWEACVTPELGNLNLESESVDKIKEEGRVRKFW